MKEADTNKMAAGSPACLQVNLATGGLATGGRRAGLCRSGGHQLSIGAIQCYPKELSITVSPLMNIFCWTRYGASEVLILACAVGLLGLYKV